jgi:hypothetical protein
MFRRRPNVLLVLADDPGQGDVSCFKPHAGWNTRWREGAASHLVRLLEACQTLVPPDCTWKGRREDGSLRGFR